MSLKSQIEAIIYAAEEPVTLEQMLAVLKDDLRAAAQSDENGAEPDAAQVKATLRLSRRRASRGVRGR